MISPSDPARNEQAAKHDRLVGAKYQAVKCVLDLPEASRDQIMATVSLWGWEGFLDGIFRNTFHNQHFCFQWYNIISSSLYWWFDGSVMFDPWPRMSLLRWQPFHQKSASYLQSQGSKDSQVFKVATSTQELWRLMPDSVPDDWFTMEGHCQGCTSSPQEAYQAECGGQVNGNGIGLYLDSIGTSCFLDNPHF